MDRTIEHERLVKKCLLMLSSAEFLVWKNNTGAIKSQNRYQTYGLKGSPDIIGCTFLGEFCGFEIKTGNAIQTKHQRSFQKAVDLRGGHYVLIRSIEDLKEWLASYS